MNRKAKLAAKRDYARAMYHARKVRDDIVAEARRAYVRERRRAQKARREAELARKRAYARGRYHAVGE